MGGGHAVRRGPEAKLLWRWKIGWLGAHHEVAKKQVVFRGTCTETAMGMVVKQMGMAIENRDIGEGDDHGKVYWYILVFVIAHRGTYTLCVPDYVEAHIERVEQKTIAVLTASFALCFVTTISTPMFLLALPRAVAHFETTLAALAFSICLVAPIAYHQRHCILCLVVCHKPADMRSITFVLDGSSYPHLHLLLG